MILRPRYIDALRTYRNIPLVKILAGIRRCGKSTILEMLRDDLLAGGVKVGALYIRGPRTGHDRP